MFRRVPDFNYLMVNESGIFYNNKTGHYLTPYKGSNGYMYLKMMEDGIAKRISVHRAVALCFCKGYKEDLVVDHIDGNKENNYYKNLRWVTQKKNLLEGYKRRGDTPVRNLVPVELYYKNKYVDLFWSRKEVCEYAAKYFGCKSSMLSKYGKHKNCKLLKV